MPPFSPAPTLRTTVRPLLSLPAITPRAQPSLKDSQVVVDLTTLLTIQHFSRFYPGVSPESFQPIYYTPGDGSLLASPLLYDLRVNNIFLIVTGSLLSIFLRNVCKAAFYLWRGKVKNKGLFYTLFLSQLLGPIAIIPLIVAQFSISAHCAVILRITSATSGLSLSLLITGILGVKAYKCLDNNRFVSGGLLALRTAASVILILDVIHLDSFRTLSGRCCRSSGLSSVFIMLLLAESFFICVCFFCAMRKSRKSLAARGSISVQLSSDEIAHGQLTGPRKQSVDSVRNRRGWSDVGPPTNHISTSSVTQRPSSLSRQPSILSICRDGSRRVASHNAPGDTIQNSKHPIPFPSMAHSHSPARSWSVRMPTTTEGSNLPHSVAVPFKRPISAVHSSVSRFARYFPRMTLFREVIRDELCYTAVITVFTVVSAAMTLFGVKSADGINSPIWIAFDWALISLLVIHSFGRVIRRHENELLLLHPSAWYHDLHTDRTTAELLWDVSQPVHAPEVLSRTRVRRSVAHNDINGSPLLSDLSTRGLFPGSAYSSRGDLHSLAASTSCISNMFPPIETELFSVMHTGRRHVDGRMEDLSPGLSHSQKSPEEWCNENLIGVSPPPEPPDEGDLLAHVS